MKKLLCILLTMVLLANCAGALADEKWFDYHCEEDGFTTRKPMHALTEYKNNKGYVGITFYLSIPGAPPYVMVHRRPAEGKFKNPENYLNNTYREFLEDKYAEYGTSVAFNPARIWEIDDKQLVGAKYDIGGTVQLQLIETRELGDVEYTAMFDPADEEATMEALEAAVTFYIEDDASDRAKAIVQAKAAVKDLNDYMAKGEQQTKDEPEPQPETNSPAPTEDPFYNQTWETQEAEQKARARHRVELFLANFSSDLSELDSKAMSVLAAAANGTVNQGQTGSGDVTVDTSWMNEDWMDEEWKKACVAAWAEERKEAKEFTAHFTEKLTEQDLLSFVMYAHEDTRYILGKNTPKDMMENGWNVNVEGDGTFSLSGSFGHPTGVYIHTEHGYFDEPILTMNAFWEEDIEVVYCGFDGLVGIHSEDPDEYWFPDETGMKLGELLSETGDRSDLWEGLVNWLVTDLGAKQSEEGIYETKISLSDGRTLYVSSHDSQVRISLVGFE